MLTFTEQSQQISNPLLVARTAAAIVKCSLAIMAEKGDVKGHSERAQFASAALANPHVWAARMVYSVVSNANCGTGASDPLVQDDPLEFVISSTWNAYASYSPATTAGAAHASAPPSPMSSMGQSQGTRAPLRRFWKWLIYAP